MSHRCKLCDMSRAIESGPLTEKQRKAIEHLWARAEAAETDLAMMELHTKEDGEFFFAGKVWVPKESIKEKLQGVLTLVDSIDIKPMASFGSASGSFVRKYISNEIAAFILKEEAPNESLLRKNSSQE